MDIGREIKTIIVEPAQNPVPQREERPAQPTRRPVPRKEPAREPARKTPEKVPSKP